MKQIDKIKKTIDNYYGTALEGELGYRFRTREFLNVIFLYKNKVSVSNPDILGSDNRNTQTNDIEAITEKIKEQVRLDLRDLNFRISNASSMARFIMKAANRKMLKENHFAIHLDRIVDNAVDFGSGFLKVWEVDGKLKMRSIDPYAMIFNQYDFSKGIKVERFSRTVAEIIDNEKYKSDARAFYTQKYKREDWDTLIVLHQGVEELKDGKQRITIIDSENNQELYDHTAKETLISYYKYDYEFRAGFPDALGVGAYEKVFNKLVQSKVNRERMDRVLEIASKLPFQKQMDNERDNMAGKSVIDLDTGVILGHKGNPITEMNTGGIKQANLIAAQLSEIVQTVGTDLNMSEALIGKTLPAGTSGVLGNLLTENASSVFKDKQEQYGAFLSRVYDERVVEWMLGVFDSSSNLRDYLDPNDIRTVERGVINYLVAQKQVDAAINDEPFSRALAEQEAKEEIKRNKKIISGELLDTLREEVQGIETYITGESFSKAQAVAFLRELRQTYAQNPELLRDRAFVEMIKKEAELDAGLSGLEIDQILENLNEQ